MKRSASAPPGSAAGQPPLPLLREPDLSGLALWTALLMAGSAVLAFLAAEPAYALAVAEPTPATAAADSRGDASAVAAPADDR